MQVKVTAPLRVDIGGGVTDVPDFSRLFGTSIVNVSIDLYSDSAYKTKTSINVGASLDSAGNQLFFNNQVVDLDSPGDFDFLRMMFQSFVLKTSLQAGVTLSINDNLPKGTGLGASAALSIAALAAMDTLKNSDTHTDKATLIKAAHHFETTEQGIQGGFQDYIAACFGGMNYINFTSLNSIEASRTLGQKLPEHIESFLNENMIFVIQQSENISSGSIVEDEIDNFYNDREHLGLSLQAIKQANDNLYKILNSPSHMNPDWKNELACEIKDSWEAQKRLSSLIGRGYMREIEELARPFVYASRGPGAGGNSLFLLTKPDERERLLERLQQYNDKIVTLFGQVNNKGLEILVS